MSTEPRDFNKEAAVWDENPGRVKLAADIAAAMGARLELNPALDVLDFGCGTGLLSLPWAPRVSSLTGADSSPGMLEVFAAKAARMGLTNVRTQYIDLEEGEELAGHYDRIVSSMTLHHIRKIAPLLAQFHRVLAPGGRLCLADLDTEDGQFHGDNRGVFHLGFDRAVLRRDLAAAGFTDVRDATAAEVAKPVASGELRKFSVFLLTGRKAG